MNINKDNKYMLIIYIMKCTNKRDKSFEVHFLLWFFYTKYIDKIHVGGGYTMY